MNTPTNRLTSLLPSTSPSIHAKGNQQEYLDASFFSYAQDFTICGGQFTTNTYANETVTSRTAVFALLKPYTCLDATKDSSARYPPPKCHPGTREKIRGRLVRWLANVNDQWKMFWVRGFAGTGKSAVAQSLADSCDEEGILGGTFFFFRSAGITKLDAVVPTLVYQLATNNSDYLSFIEHRLAKNPSLLDNSPPVQFQKLIVEPFAALQHECPRSPIAIIMDGLDECDGEDAQLEIIDMINTAIWNNPDLPLRWLIFSRPEAHLKKAFSQASECGHEELLMDAECRDNVEKYVKDELAKIKAAYSDITPVEWPPQASLQSLLDTVDGLFVLASTCIDYIGDRVEADPVSQLDRLLTFVRRLQGVMSKSPLATLDLLYLRILEDVPPLVLKNTSRILGCLSLQSRMDPDLWLRSTQTLANFLRLDQREFYKAVRGLHCVMWIPDPKDAAQFQLRFHHASFHDFLLDPHRSGKFAIVQHKALVDTLLSSLYWYELDVMRFHTNDGWDFDWGHPHDCLPGLSWASSDNRVALSQSIIGFVQRSVFNILSPVQLDNADKCLLAQASNIDFRCWEAKRIFCFARVCRLGYPTVRVEPSNTTDHRLLEYLSLVAENGIAKPATLPLRSLPPFRRVVRYIFIGHGLKSVIVWEMSGPNLPPVYHSFRCDSEPSEAQVSKCQRDLQHLFLHQEKAKSAKAK